MKQINDAKPLFGAAELSAFSNPGSISAPRRRRCFADFTRFFGGQAVNFYTFLKKTGSNGGFYCKIYGLILTQTQQTAFLALHRVAYGFSFRHHL
ncbi:hypothetical protein [Bergeriella denitrificans]|uniref:hypothetical protein n=1 Tax=Bergeriella denitrificans TaxID=494 RepID=UPI0011C0420E|nr:hypothetical protein [Bergeriella denitrificans]